MFEQTEFSQEKLLPMIIKLSIPAILSLLLTTVYSVIDRIYLGNYTGTSALAALSICFPLTLLIMAIGLTCSAGGSMLFRLYSGKSQQSKANQSFAITFILTIVFELILTIIVLVFDRSIFAIFGVAESTYMMAMRYFKIVAIGSVFQGLTFEFCDFVRASGRPVLGMVLTAAGAVTNILLDTVFIVGLHWGVAGAAWATVIGQLVSALIGAYILFSGKTLIQVNRDSFSLDGGMIGSVLYNGVVFWIMQSSLGILTVMYNGSFSQYGGEMAISMYAISSSIMFSLIMIVSGIGQGIQPIVEMSYNQSDVAGIKKMFFTAAGYTVMMTMILGVVMLLFPRVIIHLFGGNPMYIAMGVHALRISGLFAPVIGFVMFTAMFFQSAGKPMVANMIIVVRQNIAVAPFIYILPMYFGKTGIYWAEAAGDLLSLIIAISYIEREFRELREEERYMMDAALE